MPPRDQAARVKDNEEKVKLNKALPWLVGNVVELLDSPEEDQEEQVRGPQCCHVSAVPASPIAPAATAPHVCV